MSPILGRYGPFFLTNYFVVLAVGILMALAVTAAFSRRLHLPGWIDGVLLGGGAALVAGRVVYVLLNQDYFIENSGQAWAVWQGGLNAQAALLAGLFTYALWLRWVKLPSRQYLNLIAPGLALVAAAGWAACWFEGCAYGRETLPALWAADLPDDFGVFAVRYQTQAAGFLLSAAVAGLAAWRLAKSPAGPVFWMTLALLSATGALIALLRGDLAPLWVDIRADLIVYLMILVLSLVAAIAARLPRA